MADTKISGFTADAAPTSDDLVATVNDPGGTPANRKVTLSNVAAFVAATGIAITDLPAAAGTPDSDDTLVGAEDGVASGFTRAQVLGTDLSAIAALTSAANKIAYYTGAGTAAVTDFTTGGRAIVGLASAADKLPYFTGSGTASTADFTAAGRALVDDADAAAQRTTLGLGTMATQTAANYALLAGAAFTGDVTFASGTPKTSIIAATGAVEHRNNGADANPSSSLSDFSTLGAIFLGPGGATSVVGAGFIYNATPVGPLAIGTISGRMAHQAPTVTQSATPTINTDTTNVAHITGLAQAITSMTTNLSGTPQQGDELRVDITDNGTARAITWGASFQASGTIALPTTTVISTRLDVKFVWNSVATAWRIVGIS